MARLADIMRRAARSRLVANGKRRGPMAFVRDERGVTAIEFGILALPFFAIIAAIFETAFVFLANQVLVSGVIEASRMVRTGQAQGASISLPGYRDELCDHLYGLFNCDDVKIRLRTINSFSSAATTPPTDVDGNWTIAETYSPGAGSSIVMAEVYYKWRTYLQLFGFSLETTGDNERLMRGVYVFRNEPF